MDSHPPAWAGYWGVPGGAASCGAATISETRRKVVVHLSGDSKGGGMVPDDGGVHSANSVHSHAVHCYMITSGPVLGNVEEAEEDEVED